MLTPVIDGALSIAAPFAATVVTLGEFDGVHRGHQELLGRAAARAKVLGVESVAYTFDPHPAKILAPKVAPRMITSTRERTRLIRKMGIDRVLVEPFDRKFAELSADEWLESHLVAKLRPKHVVVGFNFSYGKGRGGNLDHLRRAGERFGFTVDVVEPVIVSTLVVSSTRVREFLLEGNVEGAHLLLDRFFGMTGAVIEGQKRGRTIGVPTANLAHEAELVPEHGVYASRVVVDPSDDPAIAEPPAVASVTNIGLRPTFDGTAVSIESHLLDFDRDLYGKRIRVELVARIREERRFAGVDALVAQIRADIADARRILQ